MILWKPIHSNSKHLILSDPENINVQKLDELVAEMEEHYKIYRSEISEAMMNGIRKLCSDCRNYKQGDGIILRFEIYSKMLRWLTTRNNPRYTQVKFDEFRRAVRDIWIYLFGNNIREFWWPLPNKTYYFDRELFNQWVQDIQNK
jgi:hypothetical protein